MAATNGDDGAHLIGVRVAQRGWKGEDYADTLDEVGAGLGASWVELVLSDGQTIRIADLVAFKVGGVRTDFSTPMIALSLDLIARFDVVYLGRDGEPLGSLPVDDPARQFPDPVDADTQIGKPLPKRTPPPSIPPGREA